ncbi:MAG TPA: hypothetical protein VMV90_04490 [Rectinemataceae bacterium]|nr:hypothetical protein [Rectinemataceae bacterium]
MARKRLIKGANATRVEERIARVPEDIETESNIFRALKALEGAHPDAPLPSPARVASTRKPGRSAAKRPASAQPSASAAPMKRSAAAMETSAAQSERPQAKRSGSRSASRGARKEIPAAAQPSEDPPPAAALVAAPAFAEASLPAARSLPGAAHGAAPAVGPQEGVEPKRRIGPSDFSAAEREAIVRCCADYRNRLPIYLMAVQREVEIIDSVIEKCHEADERKR